MDQITFQHDTVLSDIHMLLPNAHHLMTRLNGVGQPVFISKFKIMADGERHDRNDPGKGLKEVEEYDKKKEDGGKDTKVTQGKDGEEGGKGNVEPFLDEDGDLDIMHRPRTNPKEDSGRDVVCPVILQQSIPVLEQEEEDTDDEDDKPINNIIKIDHQAQDSPGGSDIEAAPSASPADGPATGSSSGPATAPAAAAARGRAPNVTRRARKRGREDGETPRQSQIEELLLEALKRQTQDLPRRMKCSSSAWFLPCRDCRPSGRNM